jgi:hypothetical protein
MEKVYNFMYNDSCTWILVFSVLLCSDFFLSVYCRVQILRDTVCFIHVAVTGFARIFFIFKVRTMISSQLD